MQFIMVCVRGAAPHVSDAARPAWIVYNSGNNNGSGLQRLEICNSLRSPIQVLARSASALRAAAVLPRAFAVPPARSTTSHWRALG